MSSRVQFLRDTHQYMTEDNRELISVSKFTDLFKEKVDWGEIANKVAQSKTRKGTPTTKAEILRMWERKRILSSQIGTLYHSIKEQQERELAPHEDILECPVEEGFKYSLPINQLKNGTTYPELMIYDLEYMICGQADKIIVRNGTINVFDYKTDKEITFKAFTNKWTSPRKLLPPLSHLEDCNGNIYSIKMSMYMYLLWKANKGRLRPGDITIEHVSLARDEEGIPILVGGKPVEERVDTIKLQYRKKEVIDLLKTIKI